MAGPVRRRSERVVPIVALRFVFGTHFGAHVEKPICWVDVLVGVSRMIAALRTTVSGRKFICSGRHGLGGLASEYDNIAGL